MKKYLLIAILTILNTNLFSQTTIVNYDNEKNWFNQGSDLPAETHWSISGQIEETVKLVEIQLYSSSDFSKDPIYVNQWERPFNFNGQTYTIQINKNLRGNSEYSFKINYYTKVENKEKILNSLKNNISAYLDNAIKADKKSVELNKHPKHIRDDLNQIIEQSLVYYRVINGYEFRGFSEIVYNKIEVIDNMRLKKAALNLKTKDEISEVSKVDNRRAYYLQSLEELKQLCYSEINSLISAEMVGIYKSKKIIDYSTERIRNTVKLNFGYAGLYESGDFKSLNYDSKPYLGLSIPFGNQAFSGNFWSNSSLSTGIFINNFEFNDGQIATGPLIGRPIYLGYGYKAFHYFRFNIGFALLQENNVNSLNFSKIYVRPFIGAGIEIKLWMGLD